METEKAIEILKNYLSETYSKFCKVGTVGIPNEEYFAIETILKELEDLKEYKKVTELTKISCCTAQNCEALSNSIKGSLENSKLKETLEKKDKMIKLMARFIDTELSSEHLSRVLEIDVKPLETYREDIKQYFENKAEEEVE